MVRGMPFMHVTLLPEIALSFILYSFPWRDRRVYLHDLPLALQSPRNVTKEASMAITVGQNFTPRENGGPWILAKPINTRHWPPIISVAIRQIVSNSPVDGIFK